MIRSTVIALFLVCLTAAAAMAQNQTLTPAEVKTLGMAGIKGDDDRLIVPGFEAPWSAVGRVNSRLGSFCTGTLVGADLVLTAAHCLWNKKTMDWLPVQSLHFTAGYTRGEHMAHSAVEAFQVSPGYRPKGVNTGENSAADWALLTLKDDIGLLVGYFGIEEVDFQPDFKVGQVGYSKDHKHVQTANLSCPVERVLPSGLVLHGCDAVRGDSGSPLFVWRNGVFQIVGVHVSTLTTSAGPKIHGGAAPAGQFITTARKLGAARVGSAGPRAKPPVETAQLLLPLLGVDPGAPTGELTPRTKKAVEDFQRLVGQPVTGRVSLELVTQLLDALARQ